MAMFVESQSQGGLILVDDSVVNKVKVDAKLESLHHGLKEIDVQVDALRREFSKSNCKDAAACLPVERVIQSYYVSMAQRTSESVLLSRANAEFYHSVHCLDTEKLYAFKEWSLPSLLVEGGLSAGDGASRSGNDAEKEVETSSSRYCASSVVHQEKKVEEERNVEE